MSTITHQMEVREQSPNVRLSALEEKLVTATERIDHRFQAWQTNSCKQLEEHQSIMTQLTEKMDQMTISGKQDHQDWPL